MENPLNCQIISEKIEPILKFVRYGGVKGPGIRIQITGVQRSVNIRVCGPDAAYTGRFVAAEELVSVVEKVAHREHQSQTRGVEIKRFEKRKSISPLYITDADPYFIDAIDLFIEKVI